MVTSEVVGFDDELPPHLPTEMGAQGVPRRVYSRRNVELRKYGFTQMLHGCWCVSRVDEREKRLEPSDSHKLAVLRNSRLATGADDADAGGADGWRSASSPRRG